MQSVEGTAGVLMSTSIFGRDMRRRRSHLEWSACSGLEKGRLTNRFRRQQLPRPYAEPIIAHLYARSAFIVEPLRAHAVV
jgi:hypothetical protein